MPSTLSCQLGRIYASFATLVVAALLAVAVVAAWHSYQEEHLRACLMAEGQPVTVQIAHRPPPPAGVGRVR